MPAPKTKEYRVIRENTLDAKVGDILKLTDKMARSLVNKVEPKDKPAPKAAAPQDDSQEVADIKLQAEAFMSEATDKITAAEQALADSETVVKDLTGQVGELQTQVGQLAADLAKATKKK